MAQGVRVGRQKGSPPAILLWRSKMKKSWVGYRDKGLACPDKYTINAICEESVTLSVTKNERHLKESITYKKLVLSFAN